MTAMQRRRSRQNVNTKWLWRLTWTAIVILGLVLKLREPTLYVFGAVYDDQLMVSMAHGFLEGQWSSTWATTGLGTMAKPVGYPLFLAGVHFFPWSPVWSAYLVCVLGSTLVAWAWQSISRSKAQATAALALLVLNPIAFTMENERVYRDLFIMSLATLALGLAFMLAAVLEAWRQGPVFCDAGRLVTWSGATAWRRRTLVYGSVMVLGLVVGLAAITKPTWFWMLMAAFGPLAYPLWQRLRPSRFSVWVAVRVLVAVAIVFGMLWGVEKVTKQIDERRYHVALVEDLSSGAFSRAWKVWASVEAGAPRPYVPITKAMRLAVYRVSPAAAEMEPYLEDPHDPWKATNCSTFHVCDESGPWFEWDLLSAAVSDAHVDSVVGVQTYFNRVADEISEACGDGRLHCSASPVLATGLPTLSRIPVPSVAADTFSGLWQMIWDELPMTAQGIATPTPSTYQLWAEVVPAMPPLAAVTTGGGTSDVFPILRILDVVYRIIDLVLLALVVIGLGLWVGSRLRGRSQPSGAPRSRGPDAMAGVTSLVLFVAAAIGMGTLAVFAVAQDPQFVNPLYWTDFSPVAELCLVVGVFSLLPVLRAKWYRKLHR